MSYASTCQPSPFLPRTGHAGPRLRRWLERLYRLYGQAALLGTHR